MRGKHGRWVMAGIAALLLIWMVWGNRTVGVTNYIVSSDKLPEAFDNYKIAVVSDVHNAEYGENNRILISVIQKENPDMIAIIGDLVDANKTDMEAAKTLTKQLVELAPCYYVTGNHEAWIGEQYQELEEKLLDIGVNILHDRAVKVIKNGETIQIAGLDDPYFAGGDLSVQENRLKNQTSRDESDRGLLYTAVPQTGIFSYICVGKCGFDSKRTHAWRAVSAAICWWSDSSKSGDVP